MNDRERADAVYSALLTRQGERWVQPRVERTRRVLELLDDPQRTYRVVHVTGTNGKTSTSRMIESLVRAHGLRTGLFTSPHLERFTERIMIDGEPIADGPVADAWEEISPFVDLVDAELEAAGDAPLTFFELLTVLAFVAFADAPIDVLVLEVGMGGAWDSTNTADGDVAVIAPIDIDHADRLGETIAEIAAVKAGIIKDGAAVVSAAQVPDAEAVLRAAAAREGRDHRVRGPGLRAHRAASRRRRPADLGARTRRAGTTTSTCRSTAGTRASTRPSRSPRSSRSSAADPTRSPATSWRRDSARSTSPGRLQLVGVAPTVLVDAAHNPHGARALATALRESFDFDEWGIVLGVLDDKDAGGIVEALAPVASHVFATVPGSDRASDADRVADLAEARGLQVTVHDGIADAAQEARCVGRGIRSSCRRRRGLGDPRGRGARARDGGELEGRVGRMSDSPTPARRSAPRPARGAAESLATIVLGFESLVVFLGGLAIYGLKALPAPIEQWWGIVAGAVLAVVMILTTRVLRYPWGIWLGWALQAVVALGAFLVPSLGLVALLFGAMYGYATIKGAALDRRNARARSSSGCRRTCPHPA